MAAWLDLVSDVKGWFLVDTGRLERVVQDMSHPESQFPSFIYFAGNGHRMKALRSLFPENNVMRKGPAGLVRLHLSLATARTENPIIFAESNLGSRTGLGDTELRGRLIPESRRWPIHENMPGRFEELERAVIRKFLFPWTHIFCAFVDSVPEIENLRILLQHSREKIVVGGKVASNTMRMIIVLTNPTDLSIYEMAVKLAKNDDVSLKISVLNLSGRTQMTPSVSFEPLRALILNEVHQELNDRKKMHLYFSALHAKTLWNWHLRTAIEKPIWSGLDCLLAARKNFPDASEMTVFFSDFLQNMVISSSSYEVYEFLASALLMNAYPPGMHCKQLPFNPCIVWLNRLIITVFDPEIVFISLYRGMVRQALRDAGSKLNWEKLLAHFLRAFALLGPETSSSRVRQKSLSHTYHRWGSLRSVTTCLSCMCRPPEHMMPCKHTLCDECVVLFGSANSSAEYHTDITSCPFCGAHFQLTIRRLPPTKGPLILSLDGGGVRGIIQLGLLRALERRLEPLRIGDIPDQCIGTSVGALEEVDMIFNDTSAEDGFTKFPAIAQAIFQPPTYREKLPLYRGFKLIDHALSALVDCHYSSSILEYNLKKLFGHQRRIFDAPTTERSGGCRVAIVTSRSSDGKACVLANYRGVGHRNPNAAYQFLVPQNEKHNPFLWEAAQCSVAAPFFFHPKTLTGFGSFQDGGVRANNPLAIALKESEIIWPTTAKYALVISVGTGVSIRDCQPDKPSRRSWRDSALPRMIRATLSSPCLDGEQSFRETLNYLPTHTAANVFRLNHGISETLPQLDDVGKVDHMSKMRFTVPDDLVRAVLVTGFFFFELDETPTYSQGSFTCRGSIFCSRPKARDILSCVLKEIPEGKFQTSRGHPLGSLQDNDGCDLCGYYRKKVSFTVTSMEEEFSLAIVNDQIDHKIGGFPNSAFGILQAQQAFAYFGRSDHLEVSWPPQRICYCSQKTRKRVRFKEPALEQKRRRL